MHFRLLENWERCRARGVNYSVAWSKVCYCAHQLRALHQKVKLLSDVRTLSKQAFFGLEHLPIRFEVPGRSNQSTTEELKKAGFRFSFLTHSDFADKNTDLFHLLRIALPNRSMSSGEFRARAREAAWFCEGAENCWPVLGVSGEIQLIPTRNASCSPSFSSTRNPYSYYSIRCSYRANRRSDDAYRMVLFELSDW
jgi:hypothetical protein